MSPTVSPGIGGMDNALTSLSSDTKSYWCPKAVARLAEPPTPLTFLRDFVSKSTPCVISNALGDAACSKWSLDHLAERCGNNLVSVNVTPDGRADAIKPCADAGGARCFVTPEERRMTMADFSKALSDAVDGEVPYLSRQNDSLRQEFAAVENDVPPTLPFAAEAFGKPAEAVNLWIGDDRSVSSCHRDFYENMYCVLHGKKVFTLYPPSDSAFLPERSFRTAAHKHRRGEQAGSSADDTKAANGVRGGGGDWYTELSDSDAVTWVDKACEAPSPAGSSPLVVEVYAGETLYLPATWYHEVAQEGVTVAVNYWHDMPFGHTFVLLEFLRNVTGPPPATLQGALRREQAEWEAAHPNAAPDASFFSAEARGAAALVAAAPPRSSSSSPASFSSPASSLSSSPHSQGPLGSLLGGPPGSPPLAHAASSSSAAALLDPNHLDCDMAGFLLLDWAGKQQQQRKARRKRTKAKRAAGGGPLCGDGVGLGGQLVGGGAVADLAVGGGGLGVVGGPAFQPVGGSGGLGGGSGGTPRPLPATTNFVGLLTELMVRWGRPPPRFVEVSRRGPPHAPVFTVEVFIENSSPEAGGDDAAAGAASAALATSARAEGASLRDARHSAAARLHHSLTRQPNEEVHHAGVRLGGGGGGGVAGSDAHAGLVGGGVDDGGAGGGLGGVLGRLSGGGRVVTARAPLPRNLVNEVQELAANLGWPAPAYEHTVIAGNPAPLHRCVCRVGPPPWPSAGDGVSWGGHGVGGGSGGGFQGMGAPVQPAQPAPFLGVGEGRTKAAAKNHSALDILHAVRRAQLAAAAAATTTTHLGDGAPLQSSMLPFAAPGPVFPEWDRWEIRGAQLIH